MLGTRERRTASVLPAVLVRMTALSPLSLEAQIKVACVQMSVTNSIETNMANTAVHIREEAAQACRMVVFPECAISGYDPRIVPTIPQTTIDAAIDQVSAARAGNPVFFGDDARAATVPDSRPER
jgi:hypothetical protein